MVVSTTRPAKNSKVVREYKASGNKAMQNGLFQKAVRTYTKALELDAGNAILYSNRSAAHFNIRQFAESLEDAESAILCDARWWKAYKRKGLALIHMQRYDEAIQALEDGLKIVGKNAEMEKNLEFARACQEQAQNLYILPEAHMMQRLESVPVFIVTDSGGQPFFVTYDDGQQVCTFYFDKQDAVATLEWIKAENPTLGDTARVIHITLHQAFNLAQETQKQYYEETTRAAAEEDRKDALEAEKKANEAKRHARGTEDALSSDVVADMQAEDEKAEEQNTEDVKANDEGTSTEPKSVKLCAETQADDWEEASCTDVKNKTASRKEQADKAVDNPADCADQKENDDKVKKEADDIDTAEKDKNADDSIIDENAPLSFQFRPELRQVQVAVELLNKNPNPPVRPILRDPPSVKKAKVVAKAKAEATKARVQADSTSSNDQESDTGHTGNKSMGMKAVEKEQTSDDETSDTKATLEAVDEEKPEDSAELEADAEPKAVMQTEIEKAEAAEDKKAAEDKNATDQGTLEAEYAEKKEENAATEGKMHDEKDEQEAVKVATEGGKDVSAKDAKVDDANVVEKTKVFLDEKPYEEGTDDDDNGENDDDVDLDENIDDEDDDVELTVDNFNGIPIFQAKGLTLLQKNKQLIPLFFSKWDLEDAWLQLKNSNAIGVPGECEVEVGTLEDVLRRMSECKTDEFDSVFFVPSRESMRAINVKFPLDELSSPRRNGVGGPRRASASAGGGNSGFSRAKQIAARGGTKEEIRAAIVEDLRKYEERQKMAEVVSQIEHARLISGVGGIGGVGFSSTATAATVASSGGNGGGNAGVSSSSGSSSTTTASAETSTNRVNQEAKRNASAAKKINDGIKA